MSEVFTPSTSEPGRDPTGKFQAVIDGRAVTFADPVTLGRQLLSAAGNDPADDFVLIQLERHGTRSIGLDEPVDLRQPGREAFRTFKSDRIFRFTIDGRGYEWGAPIIREAELRELAAVPEDDALLLERQDEKDLALGPGDEINLAKAGTEHLRTAKRLITVYLDDVPKKIAPGTYTTEQLIERLGVSAGYLLNVVNERGQLETLQPGQHLHLREGMKFFSQVPCGGSS
jgi:hypothetical protein